MPDDDSLPQSLRAAGRRHRLGLTLGTIITVLSLVAGLLAQSSSFLGLRPIAVVVIIVLAGFATLALSRYRTLDQRKDREREALDHLADALANWPPRTCAQLIPYDLGVQATAAGNVPESVPEYLARDVDHDVDRALAHCRCIVLIGPERCGKSRTAYEAVRRAEPPFTVLYPRDAKGLATVLRECRRLRLTSEVRPLLWLDGIERYCAELHLDVLDGVLAGDVPMTLIATAREDEVARIAAAADDAGHAGRRLLARARRLTLEDDLSPAERDRLRRHAVAPSSATSISEAFPVDWGAKSWPGIPPRRFPEPRIPRRFDIGLATSLALAVLALAALPVIEVWIGLRNPPPLSDQVHKLVNDPEEARCGSVDASPSDGAGVDSGSALVVIRHDAQGCSQSDELELYEVSSGRLKVAWRFRPDALRGRYRFDCLGSRRGDPCHVPVFGTRKTILGAFTNVNTLQTVPVAVYRDGDGYRIVALSPPPPSEREARPIGQAARVAERLDRSRTLLRQQTSQALSSDECPQTLRCLHARAMAAVAVLPPQGDGGATLLAGYVRQGSFDAPRRLIVRAAQLHFDNAEPRLGGLCRSGRGNAVLQQPATATGGVSLPVLLRRSWQRAIAQSPVRCVEE